jgi:hypothetical protein
MIVASGLRLLVAAVLITCGAACSQRRDPIILQEGTITVENQSSTAWRDVRIVVNDYFAGGGPSLAAGGRMDAPLSQFVTGFGQRFDRGRMSVRKIEVTATDAKGRPVRLEWQPGITFQ